MARNGQNYQFLKKEHYRNSLFIFNILVKSFLLNVFFGGLKPKGQLRRSNLNWFPFVDSLQGRPSLQVDVIFALFAFMFIISYPADSILFLFFFRLLILLLLLFIYFFSKLQNTKYLLLLIMLFICYMLLHILKSMLLCTSVLGGGSRPQALKYAI